MKYQHLYIDYQENPSMEDIEYDLMTNKQKEEYKKKMFLETFNKSDFLDCEETFCILREQHFEKYEKECVPVILKCYQDYRNNMQGLCASVLYYDINNSFESELKSIVYKNIRKKYDFNIFYRNPSLARPLIAKIDNYDESTEKKKTMLINSKKYDWGTNKYK